MQAATTSRKLASRAHAVSTLLGPKPPISLAFNFVNFHCYKYQFLAKDIRHPNQVFVLDKFLLLSQIFVTKHGASWFFHTGKQLQNSLGMSIKTIDKIMKKLVEVGVLLTKKSGNGGKTNKIYYKVHYPTLMSRYRGFMSEAIIEDDVKRKQIYVSRLHYFDYMAKFSRLLDAKPESDTLQRTNNTKQEKAVEQKHYSAAAKKFIAEELDEASVADYEEIDEADNYDPDDYEAYIPTQKKLTQEERIARYLENNPDVDEARFRKQVNYGF